MIGTVCLKQWWSLRPPTCSRTGSTGIGKKGAIKESKLSQQPFYKKDIVKVMTIQHPDYSGRELFGTKVDYSAPGLFGTRIRA